MTAAFGECIRVEFLCASIIALTGMSAYCSGTETAMMALNRYRLRHLVKERHRGARKANRMLRRPDRLLGAILVVTGHSDQKRVLAARDAGATEILAKPISIKTLHDRLVWVLQNPRAFIKSGEYTGPDRRRATLGFEGLEKREND